MDNEFPQLAFGKSLTLRDFAHDYAVKAKQWARLEQLRAAKPPIYVRHHLDKEASAGRIFPFVDKLAEPSTEFLEKEELEKVIVAQIRAALISGNYSVSGRSADSYDRIYLEADDLHNVAISYKNWTLGAGCRALTDVKIEGSGRPSNDDLLTDAIVVALSSLRAESTTKKDIETLVQTQATYEFSTHMFERAWERALDQLPDNERKSWTKKGPRRNRI